MSPISRRNGYIRAEKTFLEIHKAIQERLSGPRVAHSLATSELAGELCGRFGLPIQSGRLAGIGHDIAREWRAEELLACLARYRVWVGAWERAHPEVLHGRVGALLLEREFKIRDHAVLRAVADHVLGRPRMGKLSQILFAADFLEPTRKFLSDEKRRSMLSFSLPRLVVAVAEEVFFFLEKAGTPIAPLAKKMYDYFKRRTKENRV